MIKLRIKEKVYYDNKGSFVYRYKKIGLKWMENTKFGDIWGNADMSSYLRKIPEKDGYKRFYAVNVPAMVKLLMDLGAEDISNEEFEKVVEKTQEPFYNEDYSGHKSFKELLESMPLNFGVEWGDDLSSSSMSEDFKNRWRELQVKYKDYTIRDFRSEIEEKNKMKRKEEGIPEDNDENIEIVVQKKSDNDILPIKGRNKAVRVKSVKTTKTDVKEPFKKKIWIIRKKKI